jgi:copper homeostasis protein
VYSELEVSVMQSDIRYCKDLGVAGVVLGTLLPDGNVDIPLCKSLVDLAHPMQVTFHRAFDMTRDAFKAIDDIAQISGITRILTSGQESDCLAGLPLLQDLIKYANGRVRILPGGGITLRNLGTFTH